MYFIKFYIGIRYEKNNFTKRYENNLMGDNHYSSSYTIVNVSQFCSQSK
ncbi:hypothetical protein HMPREF0454_01520 [Hafnia alvei ATCC 51873]|uniref:Uncharacterized protein n=1 Tax=Hafnia alvei ATCC 51873 TaxID=1002364 RepID=G9Y4N5_HAFAL|nr:hypothetical protein HMPREF0454_01520 [Hafnia alvei ATCC 51873]